MSDYTNGKITAFDGDNDVGDEHLYGARPATDIKRPKRAGVKLVNIDELTPDAAQPRRIFPSSILRESHSRIDAINRWHSAVQNKVGNVPILGILNGDEDIELPNSDDVIVTGFIELVQFAASVKPGLINPITYATEGDRKVIETGERRWTAFIMLRRFLGTDEWNRIRAQHVGALDPARQAKENTQRRDLNAIGMARQYARLIMWSYGDEAVEMFQPMSAFDHDRDYYAQVLDYRVKRGKGGEVSMLMGGLGKNQLGRYKDLLELTPEQWDEADATNASANDLMQIVNPAQYKSSGGSERKVSNSTLFSGNRPAPSTQDMHDATEGDPDDGPIPTGKDAAAARGDQGDTTPPPPESHPVGDTVKGRSHPALVNSTPQADIDALNALKLLCEYCPDGEYRESAIVLLEWVLADPVHHIPDAGEVWTIATHLNQKALAHTFFKLFPDGYGEIVE